MTEQKTVDQIIGDVVGDVADPSPIADMSPEYPSAAPVNNPAPAAPIKGKRGRPPKTPEQKAIDAAKKDFSRRQKFVDKPQLNGIPHITPSPAPGQEGIEPCAQVATAMIAASGMALGGEGAAMMPAEQLLVKDGFIAYFRAKGVQNVPPWVILAGAITPYYMRVLATTPAKSKASLIAHKIFGIFKKAGKNARFNRGHDHERQDNHGKAAG